MPVFIGSWFDVGLPKRKRKKANRKRMTLKSSMCKAYQTMDLEGFFLLLVWSSCYRSFYIMKRNLPSMDMKCYATSKMRAHANCCGCTLGREHLQHFSSSIIHSLGHHTKYLWTQISFFSLSETRQVYTPDKVQIFYFKVKE